jgi:glycosyltransferase involved in cell wall biosynthesis
LPTKNHHLRRALKRWVHRWSRFSADDYIAVSPFVQNSLERNAGVPQDKLICVGSGIDSGRLDRQTKLDLLLPPADVRIAMMGRLDPGKGVEFAIDVIRRLRDLEAEDVEKNGKRTLPRIRVIHIGAGSLSQQIAARIQHEGLEEHFTLLGYQENVGAILRECQIGFHPSEGEVGYSLAILEMFSQKLPVLLPDLESVHASIREAKCWEAYRDRDVDDAARKLIELATDSERRMEMGRAGRALVAENFEFDRSLDVFRERVVPLFGGSAHRRVA